MSDPFRELHTARLHLRAPREGDARRLFDAYASDPEVTRFLTWRPHETVADAERALRDRIARLEDGREHSWVIERLDTREVVGLASAWLEDGAELGFVVGRRHQGHGYATEATRAVVDWCFADAGAARVWATCDAENRASARVLAKAGLEDRGAFDRPIVRPNLGPAPRPSRLFTLVR